MTGSVEDKFEYPVLTKVIGTLKYSSLKTIKDELKTNAACIHSELGGGQNGHLGLVLTHTEYTNVNGQQYIMK